MRKTVQRKRKRESRGKNAMGEEISVRGVESRMR